MKRETIELTEHEARSLIDEDYGGYDELEIQLYEHVNEECVYTDLEKSYNHIKIVIKRLSDNKYFSFFHYYSPYRDILDDCNFPIKCQEVFPKTIKQVIYE